MVRRSTWILLGVFVLLLTALLIYQNVLDEEPDEEINMGLGELGTVEPVVPLFAIPEGVYIRGMKVEDREGELVEVRRSGETEPWLLIEPEGEADQDVIERVVNQVVSLMIDEELGEEIGLETMGLETPEKILSIELSNGGTFTLSVGNVTITNSSYYVRLPGENSFVVNKFTLDSALNWLSDPPRVDHATSTPEA
jgi:hypothetical protein